MENKTKNISLKAILIVIAIGIWGIFLQNAGIIPTKQNVYVKGGYISADIDGSVSIDNEVDVNIEAINGQHNAFYDHRLDGVYNRIPVYTGN